MKVVAVGIIYFLLAKISFLTVLTDSPSGPALVWLPTGFALAAILVAGYKVWPGIILGSLLNASPGALGWPGVLGLVAANAVDPLVAAWLIRRILKKEIDLCCPWDVTVFILVATLASSVISASLGTSTLLLAGASYAIPYWLVWLEWWVSDFLGVLILVPLLLAWVQKKGNTSRSAGILEKSLGCIVGAAMIGFIFSMPLGRDTLHFVYWIIPFVTWLGFRVGRRGTTTGIFVLALVIVVATSQNHGPFIGYSAHESFLYVQSFLTVVSIVGLLTVAAIDERESAIRSRGEFFLLASHELNTPVAALGMQSHFLSELLEKNKLESMSLEQRKEMVRINSKEIQRLAALIDDLLMGARIVAGKLGLEPKEMDLNELVAAGVREHAGGQAQVQLKLEAGGIIGNWDRKKLGLVLRALLANALKYGEGNPIEVSTALRNEKAILVVTDHGTGIPLDQQPDIFERFGHLAPLRSFGGLRQSLFISKSIVSAHGGKISVNSKPGDGATFVVELPT